MSLSDDELVTLRIEPATPLTEISVSDARFSKVALQTNTGVQELRLPRGIYEVSFRDGQSVEQKLAILSAEGREKVVVSQDAKVMPADDVDSVEAVEGQGHPCIVVIVRDPRASDSGDDNALAPPANRTAGISILAENGATVAPGERAERESSAKLPFDALPGRYRLRLPTGLGNQTIEVPIVGCPGWSARVSCRLRRAAKDQHGVDVGTLQVRMYPADGASRRSPEARALERNALALLAGRRTLSGAAINGVLRDLLAQKFVNPMFGLYAGYLLRGIGAEEISLIAELVENLQALVASGPDRQFAAPPGFAHPDVEALKARLRSLRGEPPDAAQTFPFPPMLAASWQVILGAAISSKRAIPENSLSDRIANYLVGAGAYMAWSLPPQPAAAATVEHAGPALEGVRRRRGPGFRFDRRASPPLAEDGAARRGTAPPRAAQDDAAAEGPGGQEGLRIIAEALRDQRVRDWFRLASGIGADTKEEDAPQGSVISEAEQAICQAVHPIAPREKFQQVFEGLWPAPGAEHPDPTPANLAERLRLPLSTVDRAIRGISGKLAEQAQRLGIERGQTWRSQS